MNRFIALLRAINVGGHNVKMDRLRALFLDLGLADVSTFIASGNVLFSTASVEPAALERSIEAHLLNALGYPVTTFLRTPVEMGEASRHRPFEPERLEAPGSSLYVAFFHQPIAADAAARLMERRSEIDDFHVAGREVFWLVCGGMSDSAFTGAILERILGAPATVRNITTVRKLAVLSQ